MACTQEDAPLSAQDTDGARARPPRRPAMASNNGGAPAESSAKCGALCFHLPRRAKTKKAEQPVKLIPVKIAQEADDAAAQRVTFLVSASLSTWWPSSPTAAAGYPGNANAAGSGASGRVTSLTRSGGRRAKSSSFSYWRRSLSSRVRPHGPGSSRMSFSFPSSPVSISSCMSTPKLSHGCDE